MARELILVITMLRICETATVRWEGNLHALKLAISCLEEYVNHNKFLSRIYPNGTRVDSSNYNAQDL